MKVAWFHRIIPVFVVCSSHAVKPFLGCFIMLWLIFSFAEGLSILIFHLRCWTLLDCMSNACVHALTINWCERELPSLFPGHVEMKVAWFHRIIPSFQNFFLIFYHSMRPGVMFLV